MILQASNAFELNISLKKAKAMLTPAFGKPYVESDLTVNGIMLDVVDTFVY